MMYPNSSTTLSAVQPPIQEERSTTLELNGKALSSPYFLSAEPSQKSFYQQLDQFSSTMLDTSVEPLLCYGESLLEQVDDGDVQPSLDITNVLEEDQQRVSDLAKIMVDFNQDVLLSQSIEKADIEFFDPLPDPAFDYIYETVNTIVMDKAELALEVVNEVRGDKTVDTGKLQQLATQLSQATVTPQASTEVRLAEIDALIGLLTQVKNEFIHACSQIAGGQSSQLVANSGFINDENPSIGELNKGFNVLTHARRILLNQQMATTGRPKSNQGMPANLREGIASQSYCYLPRAVMEQLVNTVGKHHVEGSSLSQDQKQVLLTLLDFGHLELHRDDLQKVQDKPICLMAAERDAIIALVSSMLDHMLT